MEEFKTKFKIGDRVVAIRLVDHQDLSGKIGTIVHFCKDGGSIPIGVQFDENINGHTCLDHCPRGFGRYGYENEFDFVNEDKLDLNQKSYIKMIKKQNV